MGAYEWTEGVDPRLAIYVKYDATGINDGTSWSDAYPSLQSALNAVTANDDIYIARGTYKPSSAYSLTNTPRYYHFELINNVGIYGGFAGTETSVNQRTDFGYGGANETILSGDIGTPGLNTDNCLHVVYNPVLGITNTALLDGVTITGGNANNASVTDEKRGGAIYLSSNSPTFSNVIITGNYAIFGGGAFNTTSSAKYNNCLFFNNNADYGGAVMNFSSTSLVFNNCTFYGNTATTHGGGVDHFNSSLSYNNSIFWGNSSATGNQINAYGTGTITLNYSCFSNNSNDIATENTASVQTTNSNSTSNPLFVNPASNDFRLYGNSPCVNTGNNSYNTLSTDIRGKARIQNTTIDMGAYEWTSGVDPDVRIISWTGTTNTDWNTAGNWNPASVPVATDDVLIPDVTNDPTVNEAPTSPAVCGNLTVQSAATLTIAAGKALTVNGTLTNSTGNSGLVIQSDANGTGSLIHNTADVNATIKRYVTGSSIITDMKYHFVSLPLTSAASPTSNLFQGSYLYYFDETQTSPTDNGWVNMGTSTTNPLDITRGYMIYYQAGDNTTYSFVGPMNNGSFTATTSYTNGAAVSNKGYNLVPNPYPSAIDWNAASGWTKTNIAGTIYYWPAGATSNASNYAAWNGSIGTNNGTRYIPVGQAFFVQATGSPVLRMNNSVRVHNAQSFWKEEEQISNFIRIKSVAASNSAFDELVVRFMEGATTSFDPEFDANKLTGGANAPQFSSVTADNINLAINSLPLSAGPVVVQLAFSFSSTSEVTFTASGMDSFNPNTTIYLEDKALTKMINLGQEPVYTFSYQGGRANNRFTLHFNRITGVQENNGSASGRAFISNGRIYLEVPSMQGQLAQITVYNTLGQVIRSEHQIINGIISIEASMSTGVYVVQASSADKHFVTKVINK